MGVETLEAPETHYKASEVPVRELQVGYGRPVQACPKVQDIDNPAGPAEPVEMAAAVLAGTVVARAASADNALALKLAHTGSQLV